MNLNKPCEQFFLFFKKAITDDNWIVIDSLPKLKTNKKKSQFWPDS